MTVFLFVLTQERVMAPFNENVLGLMKVMCGTRVTLISFGTKEYFAKVLNLSTTETCRRKSEIKVTTNAVTSCRLTFASYFLFVFPINMMNE